MGNYRHKIDIIADILRIARQNAKKTHIMYQANLSYKVLTKYINEANKASLITFEKEGQCYQLTDKGHKFLELYNNYSKYNRLIEKRLNAIDSKRKILEALCSGN